MAKGDIMALAAMSMLLLVIVQGHMPSDETHSVFTVSHTRSFQRDGLSKSLGSGKKIAYSSFTYPEGERDALHIFNNGNGFGIPRITTRDTFAKVLGWEQDYSAIEGNGRTVGQKISSGRIHKVIVDWKKYDGNLSKARSDLDQILTQTSSQEVFVKVPASFLCKSVNGSPYILGLQNAKKIIVEMYGEDPNVYKTLEDIFTKETSNLATSEQYPSSECPQFPSYAMLTRAYPNIDFYIEKTLQQQEHGYLGQRFDEILKEGRSVYGAERDIFYDSYPPNLIHI